MVTERDSLEESTMKDEPAKSANLKEVEVDNLRPNMEIFAYIGFGQKYQKMAQSTCDWLIHNFVGARAVIERNGKRLDIDVASLLTGDGLIRLHRFPSGLKKLTRVNDRLISEFKQRDFLVFEVKMPAISKRESQIQRQQAIRRTEELIQKTKKSMIIRDQLVKETELFFDNVRKGKYNLSGLMAYARDVTKETLNEAMSAIAGLKASDQTYAHSIDVAVIFHTALTQIDQRTERACRFENDEEILISGLLHDIGKVKVPKDILESTEKFDPQGEEMGYMRQHPNHGAEILSNMRMSDPVINIAQCHHVKLEGSMLSSYPKAKSYNDSTRETRLLSVVDIYQALIGRRSYKRPWTPTNAMNYIHQLVGIEHDSRTFGEFYQVTGLYPVGSLVELTDGFLAFVTSVPKIDLRRPQVVTVRNAAGEDLKHQTLIDLQEEAELAIVKDISGYDIYGEDALRKFVDLQVT